MQYRLGIPKNQRTIKEKVLITGVGTHTGNPCSVTLLPSKPNMGVVFLNSQSGCVSADLFNLSSSESCTCLSSDGIQIQTVEHLLACLYGMFIDNVDVVIEGDEIPIGDGSARIFYEAIQTAGIEEQKAPRPFFLLTHPYEVYSNGSKYIRAVPSDRLFVSYSLNNSFIPDTTYNYTHTESNFSRVAYARTFATEDYVKILRKNGLARGSVPNENYISVNQPEENSLIRQECVRHKVLDLMGDLSLFFGMYILADIEAKNAGHKMHHDFIRSVIANGDR
jgi:UDP-3-O-[3-hydroxymyristoyl] N-acetylglucosamine deacetylase